MRPIEFQDSAERFVLGATEGDWRSGTSRGYYAAFHFFAEFFAQHGLSLGQGGEAHVNLSFGLQNCGFPAVEQLGRLVDDLRDERRTADYLLQVAIAQNYSQRNVQKCRQVVADFRSLLTTIPAAQIVAGVRKHLRLIGRIP